MRLPTDAEILATLDRLSGAAADDLETPLLEFKPWTDAKADMRVAVEYAVCFGNAEGGVIVFGVADKTRGRASAIHGAKGYDLDVWRRGIFDATRPHLPVEVSELAVPEGTGRLLLVRVAAGENSPYGTAQGVFKQRVGKNCMPLDPASFQRGRIATGALDWSGQPAHGVRLADLDPVEMGRARAILRGKNPESDLLRANDADFLKGLGALRGGQVTHTGLLVFGQPEVISSHCPQAQVHYVHQPSDTAAARNDQWRLGLLRALERIEQAFSLGKPAPRPESDGQRVTLRLFNTGCDTAMAGLVSRLNQEGRDLGLDTLLVLSHLREHPYVDADVAARLLQLNADDARRLLDEMGPSGLGLLERKSHTRSATFHLTKGLARELLGKAAYTKTRGLNPIRYAEMVREYLHDHPRISNREVRELLGLGESATAQVEASRYLRKWSGASGFLVPDGNGPKRRYRLKETA